MKKGTARNGENEKGRKMKKERKKGKEKGKGKKGKKKRERKKGKKKGKEKRERKKGKKKGKEKRERKKGKKKGKEKRERKKGKKKGKEKRERKQGKKRRKHRNLENIIAFKSSPLSLLLSLLFLSLLFSSRLLLTMIYCRGLSIHELFLLMKCMHALKVYTRNRRIRRVLASKARKLYRHHLLRRALATWLARAPHPAHRALPSFPSADLSRFQPDAPLGREYFVRLKGNVSEWQRAMRSPLRGARASVRKYPDLEGSDFSDLNGADLVAAPARNFLVDQDNRLFFRVSKHGGHL